VPPRGQEIHPVQLLLSFRNVAIVAAVAAAGYYAYKSFYGDIETRDVEKLMQNHRLAGTSIKRQAIKSRILAVYRPEKDYGTVLAALDQRSTVNQALAVEVFTEKNERRAAPKLLEMLNESSCAPEVKAALAVAMRVFPSKAAVGRLIELTKDTEEHEVRVAAHRILTEVLSTGAQIKFGEAMYQNWVEWWRDHKGSVRLP
jgi:hypothetical protein